MLDPCDLAFRKDAMLPLSFVRVLHPLQVHVVIDLLNQLQADNTVVGSLVGEERALAFCGRLAVELVDSLGVEDLIHTRLMSVKRKAEYGLLDSLLTKASRHWAALQNPA